MQTMVRGCHLKDAHPIGMSMPDVHLSTLMCIGAVHLVLELGDLMQMIAMRQDMKGHLLVTAKDELVTMILFPVLNARTVLWMMFLHGTLMPGMGFVIQGPA